MGVMKELLIEEFERQSNRGPHTFDELMDYFRDVALELDW